MEMIYRFKYGTRLNVSAQAAGELCAELESQGKLTPHEVVEASRPDDAPLHAAFEWDDEVAAERYREVQAGHIIRSIEVVIPETSEPTKAFHSLVVTEEKREYREITHILKVKDDRELLLAEARRELAMFKRKYAALEELANVFAAIEQEVNYAA